MGLPTRERSPLNPPLTIVKTGTSYTQLNDGTIEINLPAPAAFTVTLSKNPANGQIVVIKDGGGFAASSPITVVPAALPSGALPTIDGTTAYTIGTGYGAATMYFDGANWKILATRGSATGSDWANFRNAIDGGDFTLNPWQRGTTFTGISNTVTYTADRFFAVGGASSSISVSQQAQTDVAGFGDSLRWGRGGGTNTATIYLGQVSESADSYRYAGRQVTLSFWAKAGAQFSAAGGLLTVTLSAATTGSNDSAAHLVAASTNWPAVPNVINTTQALTTTATRYTFTGTVPATCTQLGMLLSYAPTGTNNTTDTVDFYGFQLEDGSYATVFEHRDVEVELELCQRYFFQINEPALGVIVGSGMISATNVETIFIPVPVQMRTAPTVTVSAGSLTFDIAGVQTAVGGGFAGGATHTPNYISVVGAVTATVGQATLLEGGGGAGYIKVTADF